MKNIFTLITIWVAASAGVFAQQWQWAKGISLPYSPYTDAPQISIDPSGNFYLSCTKWDQVNGFPAGSCIIKFDANGNEQWRRIFTEKLRVKKIQTDFSGNLLLTGDFRDTVHIDGNTYTSVNNDGFLMSMNSTSIVTWFQRISGPGDESANDLHRDSQGHFFVTGAFTNHTSVGGVTLSTIANTSTFIMKFDNNGSNLLMITASATAATSSNSGCRVQTDPSGNIFLLGCYDQITIDTTSLYDGNPYGAQYLAKFSPTGNPLFLKHMIDGTESFNNFKAVDSSLYFTGQGGWTSGGWTLTRKYSSDGNLVWTISHSGFYFEYTNNNLALNDSGFYTIGMQGDPNVPNWVTTYDLMLSHFGNSGSENGTFISCKGRIDGYDIAKTGLNEYLVVGFMPDTVLFDGTMLSKNNGTHFLAKFLEGTVITSLSEGSVQNEKLIIVPNPSSGLFELRLSLPVKEAEIKIYDISGNCVMTKPITNSSSIFIDLQTKSKGVYFINVDTGKEKITKKIILN